MKKKQADSFYAKKECWEKKELRKKFEYMQYNGVINAIKDKVVSNVVVSNSGGKDSIAVLLWCKENKIDEYCNLTSQTLVTGCEFNGVEEYIHDVIKKIGLKCEIVIKKNEKKQQEQKFDDVLETSLKYGIPINIRYCTNILKESFLDDIEGYEKYELTLIGNRWAESSGRSKNTYLYYDKFRLNYQPILHYRTTDIIDNFKKFNIPMFGSYKYLTRLGCVLCPMVFLRVKLSVNIVYAMQNKNSYNYKFFEQWLKNIYANCKENVAIKKGALKEQMTLFIRNYERMESIDLSKVKLNETVFWKEGLINHSTKSA